MHKKTDYFYELKKDTYIPLYNATAPAGSLAVVISIKRKIWTFLILQFLDNEPLSWEEERFLIYFAKNDIFLHNNDRKFAKEICYMLRKIYDHIRGKYCYAHSANEPILLILFVLFILLYFNDLYLLVGGITILYAIGWCVFIFNKKYTYFAIIPSTLWNRRTFCIQEKTFIKEHSSCPKEIFKQELNDIIENIPPDVTYLAGTHDIVIKRIKEFPCVQNGDIIVEVFLIPGYEKDINKFRRIILNKSCDFCEHRDTCPNYQVKNEKTKDTQAMYAVTIRRK